MPRPKKRAAAAASNPTEEQETVKRQKASSSRSSKANEPEAFQMKNLLNWFKSYTTDDDRQQLGPEAMEQFCSDIGVQPEDVS